MTPQSASLTAPLKREPREYTKREKPRPRTCRPFKGRCPEGAEGWYAASPLPTAPRTGKSKSLTTSFVSPNCYFERYENVDTLFFLTRMIFQADQGRLQNEQRRFYRPQLALPTFQTRNGLSPTYPS